MKGSYAPISAVARLHGSYLEALTEITRMSHDQARALQSDLAWQEWREKNPETLTRDA